MYKNVGEKIKVLAQVIGWTFFAAGIIVWIALLVNKNPIAWVALGSGVTMLISSWVLYGFGQMVEDIHEMKDKLFVPTSTLALKYPVEQKPTVSDELPDL